MRGFGQISNPRRKKLTMRPKKIKKFAEEAMRKKIDFSAKKFAQVSKCRHQMAEGKRSNISPKGFETYSFLTDSRPLPGRSGIFNNLKFRGRYTTSTMLQVILKLRGKSCSPPVNFLHAGVYMCVLRLLHIRPRLLTN